MEIDSPARRCQEHLAPILRELRQARNELIPDQAIALFLERTTLLDQYECDLVCRSLHSWPKGTYVWRPSDYLQEAPTGLAELERQRLSEMLAVRLRFAIEACNPRSSDTLLEGVILSGVLRNDLERVLMDAWYRNWKAWLFEWYSHYWMPTRNQFD